MEINYDFNGCLLLSEVAEDFFFSPSTNLYVYRHPLIVDKRLLRAADELMIKIEASPEKWLVNTRLCDCLTILHLLGSKAMNLPEYFKIRQDAIKAGDESMLATLESGEFIEMLATVFLYDRYMIHHPRIVVQHPGTDSPANLFDGEKIPVNTKAGRYGWIYPEKVDPETGLPKEVNFIRNLEDKSIKYWDTHTEIGKTGALMAVRGYVTSVGKISLDLGFPADAVSHKLTIRECRTARPEGTLDPEVLAEAKRLLAYYYTGLKDKTIYTHFPAWYKEFLTFIKNHKAVLQTGRDTASQVLLEDMYDVLGIWFTNALMQNKPGITFEIEESIRDIVPVRKEELTDDAFYIFLTTRKKALKKAIISHQSIVFIMGHKNPDTDTVVSAMAEGFRQYLLHGKEAIFIPVVDGKGIPAEVMELIGAELASSLLLTSDELYTTAARSGRPEWIMVDHNIGQEQPDTRAIIDHHFPSAISLRQQIPRRIIFAGSTTALVALRLYGLGAAIPTRLARIMHGAALMDTENRFAGKMTQLDELVMNRLKSESGITDESGFYRQLMTKLITCYNAGELFRRDYKEDWCFFGFAVAKGIGILGKDKSAIVKHLQEEAVKNNITRNLPLTLVKIVDYESDAETIRRERAYPVFTDNASPLFRQAVFKTIETVIRCESGQEVQITKSGESIEYWGTGTQLSRKKLAPVLDPVVNAFNQYFYSPSTRLYFKRDFLKQGRRLDEIAGKHHLTLHYSGDGIVVGNPAQLKFCLQELGLLCASPAQYFRAYFDATAVNDQRMLSHLTSAQYLETLDAIVENKRYLITNPRIVFNSGTYTYEDGTRQEVRVLEGVPGLVDPGKIDPDTGLPTEVEDPRQYGTGLWRYWSPDNACSWVLRSTIFAYDMPALDLKFHFAEELPRLSIRPCVTAVEYPVVDIYEKEKCIIVDIRD